MGSCANKAPGTKEEGILVVSNAKTGMVSPGTGANRVESNAGKTETEFTRHNSQLKIEIDSVQRNCGKNKDKKALKAFNNIKDGGLVLDAPTAVISNPQKSRKDIELIERCLSAHFIFKQLSAPQIKEITNAMKLYSLEPRQVVFQENQPGDNFFIVGQGTLEVTISSARVNILDPGMCFGEGALLQKGNRTASITTLEKTLLWVLNREIFDKILAELNSVNFQENLNFVEKVPIFKELTLAQKEALVESLTMIYFKPGTYIIKEGDNGDLLYIIKEGNAICSKQGLEVCAFSKGECFGEQALFFNSPRTATIKAIDEVVCIGINSDTLTTVLGNKLQTLIHKNTLRLAFKSNPYLKKLSRLQEDLLVSRMNVGEFEAGSVIIPSGTDKQSDIIIVLTGSLQSPNGKIKPMSSLGDTDIIENSAGTWNTDVITEVATTIAFISKELFEKSIGGRYHESVGNNGKIHLLKTIPLFKMLTTEQYNGIIQAMKIEEFGDQSLIFQEGDPGDSLFIIKKGTVNVMVNGVCVRSVGKKDYFGERSILFSSSRTATVIAQGRVSVYVIFRNDFVRIISDRIRYNLIKRIELQDDSILLSELKIVKLLGKGLSGIVFLAVHKTKQILYALKTVHRQKIFEYNLYEGIKLEREILLQLDHTFIMKLVKTFKDERRIYFLAEYVRGKDLFDVLRAMSFISESNAKFFFGCLLSAVETLHEKNIVYRDLKPENVVVDDEGYLKMIDFGTAKFLQGRTFTVLGTPQYMAPEVILRTGYGLSADYWSLGIMLFEFIFGYVPFGEDDNDPMVVYEKVLDRNIVYPKFGKNAYLELRNLIEQMLSKNPLQRNGGSIEMLKKHEWLRDFDWDALISRQAVAPYVPKIPSYEKEIEKALATNQHIDNMISHEENDKFPPDLGDEPDWDKNF